MEFQIEWDAVEGRYVVRSNGYELNGFLGDSFLTRGDALKALEYYLKGKSYDIVNPVLIAAIETVTQPSML